MDDVMAAEEREKEPLIRYQKFQDLFQQMKPVGAEELEVAEDEDTESPRPILIVGHSSCIRKSSRRPTGSAWFRIRRTSATWVVSRSSSSSTSALLARMEIYTS